MARGGAASGTACDGVGKEDLREGVAFHKMVQYLFFHQWEKLLRYASGGA